MTEVNSAYGRYPEFGEEKDPRTAGRFPEEASSDPEKALETLGEIWILPVYPYDPEF